MAGCSSSSSGPTHAFRTLKLGYSSILACLSPHRRPLCCQLCPLPYPVCLHTLPPAPCCTYPRPAAPLPRTPAHCIEWAHLILWSRERQDVEFDADNEEHMTWVFTNALARAKEYGIEVGGGQAGGVECGLRHRGGQDRRGVEGGGVWVAA